MRKLLAISIVAFAGLVTLASLPLATANPLTHVSGTEIAPLDAGAAESECPAVRPAFSGGFYTPVDPRLAAEPTAFRARGDGWRILAVNPGTEPTSINVESYCARVGHRVWSHERSATVRVAPLVTARVLARCRPGETLLAAGFRNSIDPVPGRHVVVTGLQRVGARSARVTAVNLSPTEPGLATAYAYCGKGRRPVVVESTETVAPGRVERVVAKCPGAGHDPDWSVVFGGFRASAPDPAGRSYAYPAEMRNNGGRKVTVRAVNRGGERPMRMTAIAYCR